MPTAVAGTPVASEVAEWVRPALLAMPRLARRLAPGAGPAGADDIVQDALVRAWTKWHLYDPERGTPTTWLLAITADRAREARRTRLRHLRVVDDTAEPPDIPAPVPDAEADLDLDRAIAALPDRQQLAITLHYFLGLTVAEAASVMDVTAGTVKSTLFDARTNLRRALDSVLGDDDD
jgi:RNA polymerase sigma-70 factor (ECF subfamily)